MVIAQWLERGLGQMFAPDENYQASPDHMDTKSELWQLMAPDPQFPEVASTATPPPRTAFSPTQPQPTTQCVHCQLETPVLASPPKSSPNSNIISNPASTAPTPTSATITTPLKTQTEESRADSDRGPTVFLSPTPFKKKRGTESTSSSSTSSQPPLLTAAEHEILVASRDTLYMQSRRNPKFRDQAGKLLQFCSSTGKLQARALQGLEKLLTINAKRLKACGAANDQQEPNLLYEARSVGLGAACPDGYTPLHATAKSNQVQAAALLWKFATGENSGRRALYLLEQTNLFGQTALHIAAQYGQVHMVEFLQKCQETLNTERPPQRTPEESTTPGAFEQVEDVTGQTAWGLAMTSPNPKARQHREKLDELLSPPPASSGLTKQQGAPVVYAAADHLHLRYATAHLDGRRVFNEDAILCAPLAFCQGLLLLVCDGHGDCGSVAHFVAQQMPTALEKAAASEQAKEEQAEEESKTEDPLLSPSLEYWTRLCQAACWQVETQLKSAHLAGGCTACFCIVTASQFICANVGDSRCVLVSPEGGVPLSTDHKPHVPAEQARIERAGLAVVHETYTATDGRKQKIPKVELSALNRLAVSRAFGDFEYKHSDAAVTPDQQAVVSTPEVQVVPRHGSGASSYTHLVVACDGIWDVQSNDNVAQHFGSPNTTNLAVAAQALVQKCLSSGDNLSLIVAALEAPRRTRRATIETVDTTNLTNQLAQLDLQADEDDTPSASAAVNKTLVFSPEKEETSAAT